MELEDQFYNRMSMNEEIDIRKEGKDLLIGFNPKFLIDALRVIDDEEIDNLHGKSESTVLYQG